MQCVKSTCARTHLYTCALSRARTPLLLLRTAAAGAAKPNAWSAPCIYLDSYLELRLLPRVRARRKPVVLQTGSSSSTFPPPDGSHARLTSKRPRSFWRGARGRHADSPTHIHPHTSPASQKSCKYIHPHHLHLRRDRRRVRPHGSRRRSDS